MSDMKQITLYRIKDGKQFADFLKGDLKTYTQIKQDSKFEGYIKYDPAGGERKTEENIPWLRFLNSGFPEKKFSYESFNRYPRAIMALRIIGKDDANDVFYVATFGQHGDVHLNKEQIVYDFGIRVGMNICDAEKLRRIQTAAHEAISQQIERQASTGASLGVFGVDADAEFLRTISGHVQEKYKNLVHSFRGKDSIAITFPRNHDVTWTYLADLCQRLEERYVSDDYTKTDLKFYDTLRHESDPVVIAELNRLLCAAIEAKKFEGIHLAPPEFVTSDDASYSYVKKDGAEEVDTFGDLRITDLIAVKGRRLKDLDHNRIKSWTIYEYNHELDKTFKRWDAYRCLVAEVEWKGRTFVLSSGQWREVSKELKETVQSYLRDHDMVVDPAYLPNNVSIFDAKRNENREEVFNRYIAGNSDDIYLLDKAKVEVAGQRRYEICDLLHIDRSIIHVKRYSSGAASISHLFTQGRFYAHAFSTDVACRAGMAAWINADTDPINASKDKIAFLGLIPEKKADFNERDYLVVFCVLHDDDEFSLDRLPFMSRYELMQSHRFLTEDRSFRVAVVFRKVVLGP